ncbi:MAG: class I SAM-dependent rRNA methyltransferase [Deltaproteobacteria bacterium]|nr:class I SAM-dependent rRNA methyltransferase [Deltaproteobacteria bacterium]
MTSIRVSKKCIDRMACGHLWVFDNEIRAIDGHYINGAVVSVRDASGRFVARGYINDKSKITVRVLTFKDEPVDGPFLRKRISDALQRRLRLGWMPSDSFRVLSSEGDRVPGLIIDKYKDILSIQTLTLGMERRKEEIVNILMEVFSPSAIVERNDAGARKKEGLPQVKGFIHGNRRDVAAAFDGLEFSIDLLDGHKTGFYLDQTENRRTIAPYVRGGRVLDCFAYTGGFSVYSAKYGAKEIVALEDSGTVFERLKENIRLNAFDSLIQAEKGDAFRQLREKLKRGERFDCVILDPPSFVKAKEAMAGAQRGYKDINLLGLKLLNEGGHLVTSSCSQNISPLMFTEILKSSARDAGCVARTVDVRSQARDHPILLGMPETHYLKFVVLQKAA